jgi:hypothetical protein|tara:strand:+ start:1696 stop:2196 length:501 start_codon:yes stop_codon:yes gene_type:complete
MDNKYCLKYKHNFKKRINNDLKLFDNYNNLILDKLEEKNVDNKYFIFIYLKINKIKYLFKLKHDYPFSAPEILINIENKYTDYYEYLFDLYCFYKNKINTNHITCPCCFNLLCNYNLNYKLVNFIDEIIKYNKLIMQLSNKYFGLLILNKKNNLNDYINSYIIEYL